MKEYIKKLLNDKDKSIQVNIKAKILKIKDEGEYIPVEVEYEGNIYKGLTIIKSDIFPIPNEND